MTWNVRTADFDPVDWAPVVAGQRPDVLGLQEVCAGEAVALAELLGRDHGLAYETVPGPVRPAPVEDRDPVNAALRRPCRDGAVVQYGLAVLTRLPVTSATTELFAPDHRDEQRGYQRIVLRGPLGAPLTVLNAHLGLAGVAGPQIRDLAAAASVPGPAPGGPTVVIGDLNTTPDDGALSPLRTAFAEVDPAGRVPTSGNRPDTPGAHAESKIDYVFHRGPVCAAPPEAPWVPSSDHRPLVATLRWVGAGAGAGAGAGVGAGGPGGAVGVVARPSRRSSSTVRYSTRPAFGRVPSSSRSSRSTTQPGPVQHPGQDEPGGPRADDEDLGTTSRAVMSPRGRLTPGTGGVPSPTPGLQRVAAGKPPAFTGSHEPALSRSE